MDPDLLLPRELRRDFEFQLSLLRLMYPKTGPQADASSQVAQLEQLRRPAPAPLTIKPAR